MTQDTQENLSAGIDGELSREELRFLLRRLDHDATLQQTWTRYHLARDGLRRQLPPLAAPGFAARVMLAIEQESRPASSRRRHWLRWSAGGAIAASVAVAALTLVQPVGEIDGGDSLVTRTASAAVTPAAPAPASPTVPAAVPPWLSGNSAGLYSQRASATFGGGLSPYAQDDRSLLPRYRTLDNHDGSYLLLFDPPQQAVPDAPSWQAAATAQ